MNASFSEYILYEPTLRILTARGFSVECEFPCPGFDRVGPGDVKKIDFVATGKGAPFAIEMKWARSYRLNIELDIEKLTRYKARTEGAQGFLCVFGRKSHLQNLKLQSASLNEQGAAVYAEFGVTRYGCRTYEVTDG